MFKNISNLGKTLKKEEQKSIKGGIGCSPYECWLKYGGLWLTEEDFFCKGNICGIRSI